MELDDIKNTDDITTICNEINKDIIDAYNILKNHNFFRAFKYPEDQYYFEELIMKESIFNLKIRKSNSLLKVDKAINYFDKMCKSYNDDYYVFPYTNYVYFTIYEKNKDYVVVAQDIHCQVAENTMRAVITIPRKIVKKITVLK